MRGVKKVAAILGGVASVGAVAIGSVGLAGVGFPSGPAHAQPGFSTVSSTNTCQGNCNSGNTPQNTNNQGTQEVTVETTGPKGALKNSNTPDNKVTENSTVSGPGNSQG